MGKGGYCYLVIIKMRIIFEDNHEAVLGKYHDAIVEDAASDFRYMYDSCGSFTRLTIPDATTTLKGKIKLAGDLSGTADLPTVPGLTNKVDKGELVVNVKDAPFNAVGDGIADDTAAIQAAIDSISQSSIAANTLAQAYRFGGKVFLPKGKYRTTSTLYLPAYVELVGQSRPGFANFNQTVDNIPGSVIVYDPTDNATYAIMTGNFVVSTGLRKTTTTSIIGSDIDDHVYSEARDTCLQDLAVYAAHTGILGGILFNGAANSRCINVTSVNFGICR